MKHILSALLATAVATQAATTFTGALDSDFATAGNWDNGLPTDGNDGTISGGKTADLATTYSIGTTGGLTVGASGSAGTLNINNGGTLAVGTRDLHIGEGTGSTGAVNVNNGGKLTVLGAGADLFIGRSGGTGTLTIGSGGTLDARKAIEIISGTLSYAAGATALTVKDEFVVDNNGILAFATDGAAVATIPGESLALELGAASTLHMNLGGSFAVGDTWTLFTGISSFGGVAGGDGTGVFGSVSDPSDPSRHFTVHYGTGLAAAGELVVELTDGTPPALGNPASWPDAFLENAPQTTADSAGLSAGTQVGQSFALTGDATVDSVVIQLDDAGASPDLTGSLTLEISAADGSGLPTGAPLATMTGVLPGGLGPASFLEFDLPGTVALATGNYALTLTTADADLRLNSTTGDLVGGGDLLENTGGGWAAAPPAGRDLVFGLTGTIEAGRPAASSGPNIIFVLVDDWGWTDHDNPAMAQGHQSDFYQTPNFDRLVDSGVAFTSTYAQPNCAPTRAALFTGQYSCRSGNGVYNVTSLNRAGSRTTYTTPASQRTHVGGDEQTITVAEAFYNSGYVTAHFGKFHVGSSTPTDPTFPLNQGFDHNYGGGSQGNPGSYWSDGTMFNGNMNGAFDAFAADYSSAYIADNLAPYANGNNPTTLENTHKHLTDAIADAFVSFMNSHRSGAMSDYPVYVQLHFYAVHTPTQGRPDLVTKYNGLPNGTYHSSDSYAALVEGMDHSLGRIMDYLDDPDGDGNPADSIAANTLLVFCSDNGGQSPTVNTPLRGRKGMHYNGGIRVPCAVRMPGTIPAGKVSDTLVHVVDFYPTMLDFAGGVYPDAVTHPLDGVSLHDHLLDPDNSPRNREPIFYHFPGYMDSRAYACSAVIKDIGGKRYKYIYAYDPYYEPGSGETVGFDQYQLYNLTDDISETTNLLDYIDLENPDDPDDPATDEEYWNYLLHKDIGNELAANLHHWLDHGSPDPNAPADPTWTPVHVTYKSTFPGIDPALVGQAAGPPPASIPDMPAPPGKEFRVTEVLRNDTPAATVTVTFVSEAGFLFDVQASPDLAAWVTIASDIPGQSGTTTAANIPDPPVATDARRFYRAVLRP